MAVAFWGCRISFRACTRQANPAQLLPCALVRGSGRWAQGAVPSPRAMLHRGLGASLAKMHGGFLQQVPQNFPGGCQQRASPDQLHRSHHLHKYRYALIWSGCVKCTLNKPPPSTNTSSVLCYLQARGVFTRLIKLQIFKVP